MNAASCLKKIPYNARLVLLAALLAAVWFGGGFEVLEGDELRLWNLVRAGQNALWERQASAGVPLSAEDDKLKTGFIGTEWSPLSTTLGEKGAKRTSCNPLWAVQCLSWFDDLGIKPGDRVAIYSSASFPGLLFSALAAAESRGLDVLLVVSLGSSTWGANRPEFPWPEMYRTLADGGFVKTRPEFYTLGGGGERGDGIEPEVIGSLREMARRDGVPLVLPRDLGDAVRIKSEALLKFNPKLMINIGGSNANLGDSELAADIPPGLLIPGNIKNAKDKNALGDGVIARSLADGVPVLHLLNMRRLSLENGIPWDAAFFSPVRVRTTPTLALAALAAFAVVLAAHRRWEWGD
ncbi:poly-gamma-glutamate system protein [Synergistales bacterium]|nr:poly-gamma-glutamate system protein [Synergistales bacterium]